MSSFFGSANSFAEILLRSSGVSLAMMISLSQGLSTISSEVRAVRARQRKFAGVADFIWLFDLLAFVGIQINSR
jgi:hypothetical protein